jgi:hypothetical protein
MLSALGHLELLGEVGTRKVIANTQRTGVFHLIDGKEGLSAIWAVRAVDSHALWCRAFIDNMHRVLGEIYDLLAGDVQGGDLGKLLYGQQRGACA